MPDASLPGARPARSLTIAGALDVALGASGLIAATLMALAIGVVVWIIAVVQWVSFVVEGTFVVDPNFRDAAAPLLAYGAVVLVSVFADACLLATGIQLLGRSRSARRSAFLFAVTMVPLGAIDVVISQHAGALRGLVLALVLLLPIYSVAQLAAFFVLPSWRALTTGSAARSTS